MDYPRYEHASTVDHRPEPTRQAKVASGPSNAVTELGRPAHIKHHKPAATVYGGGGPAQDVAGPLVGRQYIDYSTTPICDLSCFARWEHRLDGVSHLAQKCQKKGTFQYQLYKTLKEISREGNEDIVSWKPHGRAFEIHDKKEFEKKVLHRFFATTKYLSFKRQLSLYSFTRVEHGVDKNSYFHEHFLRGRPDLMSHIRRRSKKHHELSINVLPNFYELPPCRELSAEQVRCLLSHHFVSADDAQTHEPEHSSAPGPTPSGSHCSSTDRSSFAETIGRNRWSEARHEMFETIVNSAHDEAISVEPIRMFQFEETVGCVGKLFQGPTGESVFTL